MVLGFLVAPLMPAFIIIVIATAMDGSLKNLSTWPFKITMLFSYPVMAAFGLPSYLILRRLRVISIYPYMIIGFILAVIIVLTIYAAIPIAYGSFIYHLRELARIGWISFFVGSLGAISGLSFWLIVRPDLYQKS